MERQNRRQYFAADLALDMEQLQKMEEKLVSVELKKTSC